MTDTPKQVKNKINKHAYSGGQPTVEEHREKGGNVDLDIACQWLLFFEEDDRIVSEIHKNYKKGELLSDEVKKEIIKRLNVIISEHQKIRETAESQIDHFLYKIN